MSRGGRWRSLPACVLTLLLCTPTASVSAHSPDEPVVGSVVERRTPPPPPFPMLLPAQPPSVHGLRSITVVLIEPVDGDRRRLNAAVAATVVSKANEIWGRLSEGRIRFRLVRTVQWVRARETNGCEVTMGIDIGKRIGWKPAPNHHLVMIEPNGDCSPRGMAFQRSHAVGNYVWLSWDPNRYFFANSVATTLAHELGHNFVLGHTSLATCSPALQPACSVADEFPSETRDIEYGGDDLMGGFIDAGSRSLNPIARWQLRLLRPKDLLTIDTRLASNRRIRLVAPGRPGTQAVRIVDVEGGSSWWISFDSTPTCPFGDRQPWCLITGSSNEAVRVHVMLGPRLLPLIGQQRSDTGSMHLTVGTAYPFPGGQLTVVSLGGAATIDVTTTGP